MSFPWGRPMRPINRTALHDLSKGDYDPITRERLKLETAQAEEKRSMEQAARRAINNKIVAFLIYRVSEDGSQKSVNLMHEPQVVGFIKKPLEEQLQQETIPKSLFFDDPATGATFKAASVRRKQYPYVKNKKHIWPAEGELEGD